MITNRKRSIFCEKQPGFMVGDAAIFIDGVWVLCKGRRYYDGSLKYWHNGRQGKVDCKRWINLEEMGMNKEQKKQQVCQLNTTMIQRLHPHSQFQLIGRHGDEMREQTQSHLTAEI